MYRSSILGKWRLTRSILDPKRENWNTWRVDHVRCKIHQCLRKTNNEKGFPGRRNFRRIIRIDPGMKDMIYIWFPGCKWLLVFATASDLMKPEDRLSVNQYGALMVDGFIGAHQSMKLMPVNWNQSLANAFLFLASMFQFARVIDRSVLKTEETEHGYRKRLKRRLKKLTEIREQKEEDDSTWYRRKARKDEKSDGKTQDR